MPRARIVLMVLGLALACPAAAGALAAQAGRWNTTLDVLSHLAPAWLAAGVAALILAAVLRRSGAVIAMAVLGGVAVIASLVLILPELTRPVPPAAAAGGAGEVKVVQFNVSDHGLRLDEAVRWLAAEEPDFLVIEESTPQVRNGLASRLNRHVACGQTCFVAILSREPPSAVDAPRRGRYGLGPAITIGRYGPAEQPVVVAGVHYVWPTQTRTHAENSRRLMQILKDYDRERLILAGDFNSTPWSFERRREDAELGLTRRTRALFSWPARGLPGFPFLPIDHVYAGPGWRTVEVRRGPRLGSDHYPIVAVLAPAEQP
ncbi:MAG: endonuclease/exonuclease/phosphatase family protein [Phenylobacterium sp.]|uniref:endonuclease/exonuclease/phosphatase family protein n=1 Tax=Phenylobacterium sp. TaxID=1871053 RepID=UPI00391C1CBF